MPTRARFAPATRVPVLVLALLVLLLAPAAATAATVTVSATGGNDVTCAPAGAACATLARAVTVAQPGDSVQVGAGEFPAATAATVTKRLTILGAQAGNDARTRTPGGPGESTLIRTSGAAVVSVNAGVTGLTIDGFSFRSAGGGSAISTRVGGNAVTGLRIVNNTFSGFGNAMTLNVLNGPGNNAQNELSKNLWVGNTSAYISDTAENLTIADNVIQGGRVGEVSLGPAGSNVTFTRNQVTGGSGPAFAGVVGLDVTDNTITGPGSVGITLIGRENANLRVARNTITGMSDAGISLALNPRSAVENREVTILENTILDTGGDGVRIGAGGADGPVTVTENRIVDSSRAGLRNQDDDAAVNAQRNWWGCNLGPGFEGCDAVTSPDGGTTPVVTPWLTLSLAATPAELDAGASNSLLARLTNLSSGGLADGPFFREAPAAFDSLPAGGTYDPQTALLRTPELAATTAFTAGPRPTEWSVTVDNQTVQIFNSDPPAPDVIPDIVPSDPTLRPGQQEAIVIVLINRGNEVARRVRACTDLSEKLDRSGERCRRIARLRPGQTVAYRVLGRVLTNACRGRLAHRLILHYAGLRGTRRDRAVARLLAGRCAPPAPCPTVARASRDTRVVADRRARAAC